MLVRLILITPDLVTKEKRTIPTIELFEEDYKGKTIKEVVAKHAFSYLLKDKDPLLAKQAVDLIFDFIQPIGISNPKEWWDNSFESQIIDTNELKLELEFNEEGKEFLSQIM